MASSPLAVTDAERSPRGYVFGLLLCGVVLAAGCRPSGPETPAGYRKDIEQWRAERASEVKQHWASLAGLYWLEQGAHPFGSDSSNRIVFPPSAPPHIGTFFYDDSTLRVTVEPGIDVRHGGAVVEDTLRLRTDDEGTPTTLTLGRLRWYVIERAGRLAVRLHDRTKAAQMNAGGLSYYPLRPAWRIEGRFVPHDTPRTISVPTVLGTTTEMSSPGAVTFEIDGRRHRLDVFEGGPDTYFTLFADATNQTETYEAGRYLYLSRADSAGAVVIDFNKAYNPPCAFTPYATCPFPPAQNRLPLRVEAGEKRYRSAPPGERRHAS